MAEAPDKKITGLISGKFAPLHKGHELFVNQALQQCDELYLLMYQYPLKDAWFSATEMAALIKDIFKDKPVHVIECRNPPAKGFSEADVKAHRDYAKSHIPENVTIDRVFCNEKDGKYIAACFDAELIETDMSRVQVPTSSGRIRADFEGNKHHLHPTIADALQRAKLTAVKGESSRSMAQKHRSDSFVKRYKIEKQNASIGVHQGAEATVR